MGCVSLAALLCVGGSVSSSSRRIAYGDLPPAIQRSIAPDPAAFRAYLDEVEAETGRRVAEGERDHLIYYALQSKRFTNRPRIEPALSARAFVERLPRHERERLLADAAFVPAARWPDAERRRVEDLIRALRTPSSDARLSYFAQLLHEGGQAPSADALYADYVRVVRFLYRKEFGAPAVDAAKVAQLYQTRPHSSDTEIEAGFGVSVALAALRALDPALRASRVLIVGPGLDFAPRTDLIDAVEPQSYQPFAVADALLASELTTEADLRVHAVDVNPRVVRAVDAVARRPVTLHLFTAVHESAERPFSGEFQAYLRRLGRAIGREVPGPPGAATDRRYRHSIAVRETIARAISAERLNVITERLAGAPFDIAIVTNVMAYFDDRQLALALANIAAMLRPGGHLVHNEVRPVLPALADSLDIPAIHMRSLVLRGPDTRPLYDVVYVHQKKP